MRLAMLALACTLPMGVQAQDSAIEIKPVPPAGSAVVTGRAAALDGDTIIAGITRIRLWGIDAPEARQTCPSNGITLFERWQAGQHAYAYLKNLLLSDNPPVNRVVNCRIVAADQFRRSLARCTVGSIDLSAAMVEAGMAWASRQYTAEFVPQEEEARRLKRGVWAHPCAAPWDWRRIQEQRDPALRPPF